MVRYRNLSNRVDTEQYIEVGFRLERHIEKFLSKKFPRPTNAQSTGYQYQEVLSLNRTSEQQGGF
jgi:hypothetical protein